jgi:hypothetical protein
MIITGDRRLRSLCDDHEIPVHGGLWLMDMMDERGVFQDLILLMPSKR